MSAEIEWMSWRKSRGIFWVILTLFWYKNINTLKKWSCWSKSRSERCQNEDKGILAYCCGKPARSYFIFCIENNVFIFRRKSSQRMLKQMIVTSRNITQRTQWIMWKLLAISYVLERQILCSMKCLRAVLFPRCIWDKKLILRVLTHIIGSDWWLIT